MTTRLARWIGRGRLLTAVSILLPLLLFAAAAWYDRGVEVARARDRVVLSVRALAEHAEAALDTTDLVLARVADRIGERSWDEIRTSPEVHTLLSTVRQDLPQVESVFVVDAAGRIAASSRAFPMQPFDVRDREYFAVGRRSDGLFVSAPFRGQSAGTVAFTVSRPLDGLRAAGGLVAVTVYPGYFQGFYRAVLQHPGATSAALVRSTDGSVLLRYPEHERMPQRLGPDTPLMSAAASGAEQGLYAGRGIDDRPRLSAFRRLSSLPLLVSYSFEESAYLAAWYDRLGIFAVFAVIIGIALFLGARLTLAQTAREQEGLRLLVAETERRREAEQKLQQVQKMEALGRLTGGVAHDFNNLLTAVLGALELSMKRITDGRVLRLLGMAQDAANRGAKLTGQMLAFARKQDVALRTVEPEELLLGMGELLQRTSGALVRIGYHIQSPTWPVRADPVQLEVALLNLAANAADAMPLGGAIAIRTRNLTLPAAEGPATLPAGDYVAIAVCDTGEGMSEAVRARAFEPFFTTKPVGKGTGLGLAMVFGMAEQAGGTATIESAPGAGTTVTLYLRRGEVDRAAEAATPTRAVVPTGLRVLLVDDDAGVRTLTGEILASEMGHTVIPAEDGLVALAALRDGPPVDLMILDFAMPGMNGSDVFKAARKLRPQLPVLLMTGYVDTEALAGWSELGCHTLNKPFSSAELGAAVATTMAEAVEARKVVPLRAV